MLSTLLPESRRLLGTGRVAFYMPDFYSLEGRLPTIIAVSAEAPENLLLLLLPRKQQLIP